MVSTPAVEMVEELGGDGVEKDLHRERLKVYVSSPMVVSDAVPRRYTEKCDIETDEVQSEDTVQEPGVGGTKRQRRRPHHLNDCETSFIPGGKAANSHNCSSVSGKAMLAGPNTEESLDSQAKCRRSAWSGLKSGRTEATGEGCERTGTDEGPAERAGITEGQCACPSH